MCETVRQCFYWQRKLFETQTKLKASQKILIIVKALSFLRICTAIAGNENLKIIKSTLLRESFKRRFGNAVFFRVQNYT